MANIVPKSRVVNIMAPNDLMCDFSRSIVEERLRCPGCKDSKGDPGMLYDAYSRVYSALIEGMSEIGNMPFVDSQKKPDETNKAPPRISSYGDEYGLTLSGPEFEAIVKIVSHEDLRSYMPLAIAAFEELACYSPELL
jgi:hypothetical protein